MKWQYLKFQAQEQASRNFQKISAIHFLQGIDIFFLLFLQKMLAKIFGISTF